jgi:hypothetical protein
MNCRKAKKILVQSFEEDLSSQMEAELQEHILACPACAKEKDLIIESMKMLEHYKTPELGKEFTSSLMLKIRSRSEQSFFKAKPAVSFIKRVVLSGMAACLTILAVAGIYYHFKKENIQEDQIPVARQKIKDDEIIRNLEIYENIDLLENLSLFDDLDIIEQSDNSVLDKDAL